MTTTGVTTALSNRELEILYHVAAGGTNGRIAQRLDVSSSTVKTHVSHLQKKLHALNRANLVHIAHEEGLFHQCPHDHWYPVDETPLRQGKQWQCERCGVVRATGWVPAGLQVAS